MLNAVTIAAIVAAVWAHPSGVSYLEKINRLHACRTPNPCCQPSGGYVGTPINYLQAKRVDAHQVAQHELLQEEDDVMLQLIVTAITRGLI